MPVKWIPRTPYREQLQLQLWHWVRGDSRHLGRPSDPLSECCPDFSCCQPDLLATKKERIAFAEAGRETQERLLGKFLGRLIDKKAPGKKVRIVGP